MTVVALPPFDDRGVLPPTDTGVPYPATLFEVRRRFVVEQAGQPWRRQLFRGWLRLALHVDRQCPGAYWWLWGSFVSAQAQPRFGDREALTCLVLLPYVETSVMERHDVDQLVRSLQQAEAELHVDPCWVLDGLPSDHELYLMERFFD